jgi:flagellar motility protein MotE (MotC chaperone)
MKKIALLLFLSCLPLPALLYSAASMAAEEQNATPSTTVEANQEKSYSSVEERRLFNTLEQERAGLQEKIKVLADKEKELKTLAQEVDKKFEQMNTKIKELKKVQQKTEELLALKDQAELNKIKELSKIYAKMSPEKAALALSSLDDQQLTADLIANMKTKSAAKILEQLDKLKVAELTTTLSTLSTE